MKQLFKNLDIDNYTVHEIKKVFLDENGKSDVYITFKWTPGRRLVFFKLHLKVKEGKKDLLGDTAINTKTGTQSFFIGSFDNNDELEISYSVKALVDIPKIITILTQNHPDIAYQASPDDPEKTNKIDSGADFDETIKHKVQ